MRHYRVAKITKKIRHIFFHNRFFHNRRSLLIGGGALCAAVLIGAGVWYSTHANSPQSNSPNDLAITIPVLPRYVSKLTGLESSNLASSTARIIGVMIDNHPDARPQSGLAHAPVVYEVPVEGGITRFLALFEEGAEVAEAGPVRSARPYYIDWLAEYGQAVYLHSGGSPEALARLRRGGEVYNGDEFALGKFFKRSPERYAPHNLYTSSASWHELIAERAVRNDTAWSSWLFGAGEPASSTLAKAMTIPYRANYTVGWKYDFAALDYVRSINGQVHTDKDASVITAHNVIIQFAEVTIIDDEGRRRISTLGENEALVLTRGQLIHGHSQKPSLSERTRWYDTTGAEIPLTPGKTWIQIVPASLDPSITY